MLEWTRSYTYLYIIYLEQYYASKAPGADSMINEFLKYGGSDVRNKLMKIMNMIFEKGEVPNDFRKTLRKPLYKKGDKSECRNYMFPILEGCILSLFIWII